MLPPSLSMPYYVPSRSNLVLIVESESRCSCRTAPFKIVMSQNAILYTNQLPSNNEINVADSSAFSDWWADWTKIDTIAVLCFAKKSTLRFFNKRKHISLYCNINCFGYNKLPDRRLYWVNSPDVRNTFISNLMRRDVFEGIMKSRHIAYTMEMDVEYSIYKVRCLFDMLTQCLQNLCFTRASECWQDCCILWKSLIETVHIGKANWIWIRVIESCFFRWIFVLCDPYSGSSTKLPYTGIGQGPDIVLGLIDKVHAREDKHIVSDNLFSSIMLLNELWKRGIANNGTMRENRFKNSPLPPKKV